MRSHSRIGSYSTLAISASTNGTHYKLTQRSTHIRLLRHLNGDSFAPPSSFDNALGCSLALLNYNGLKKRVRSSWCVAQDQIGWILHNPMKAKGQYQHWGGYTTHASFAGSNRSVSTQENQWGSRPFPEIATEFLWLRDVRTPPDTPQRYITDTNSAIWSAKSQKLSIYYGTSGPVRCVSGVCVAI